MWFWWFILVCDLLVPFTMLIAGRIPSPHTRLSCGDRRDEEDRCGSEGGGYETAVPQS